MAEEKRSRARAARGGTTPEGFTEEERQAMADRAKEVAASRRRGKSVDEEPEVLAKIAEMPQPDRAMAERLHALVRRSAPGLAPRLWYGMPAYAREGTVVCFFQAASKFKARYATFGFNDAAHRDDGAMWPTSFALTELTDEAEARLGALVARAAG